MNELSLYFDRLQEQPLSIIVGALDFDKANTSMPGVSDVSSLIATGNKGANLAVIRGILQSYQYPKRVDYRLIKTFGGDNYLYFFGEEVPILRMVIEFTDGTIFTSAKGWKGLQEDLDSYETLNVLRHMESPNKFFYGASISPSENVPATFVFNRVVFNGFILEMDVMGAANKKGTLTSSMGVIIKKQYTINVNTERVGDVIKEAQTVVQSLSTYAIPGSTISNSINSVLNQVDSVIAKKLAEPSKPGTGI